MDNEEMNLAELLKETAEENQRRKQGFGRCKRKSKSPT